MIYAFKRRRALQGCLAFFALGIVVGVTTMCWFAIPANLWPLKLLVGLPALALGFTIPGILIDTFSAGPILTISAEGIRYLPFSRETVPWTAIRSVTLKRSYSHQRGSSDYYRFKLFDGVSYVVIDPKRFPVPPGGMRADNIAVSIMQASVRASPQEIADAIRACWSGEVREVDDAPPDATLH